MSIVQKSFSLDVVPGYAPPTIHVSEYDVGRRYSVSILDDGVPLNLHPNLIATIDGTVENYINHSEKIVKAVFKDISANVEDNKVIFDLTEEMTAHKGRAWCKIKFKAGNESISTCGFILEVDRAGVEANTLVQTSGFMEQVAAATSNWILENASGVISGPVADYLDSQDPQTIVMSAILLAAHPVGSYYWSSNPTEPSTLFGGTWDKVRGTFLFAEDDGHSAGSVGGNETHTISIDEMPTHTHDWKGFIWNDLSNSGTKALALFGQDSAKENNLLDNGRGPQPEGSSQPMNIMPPYLAAYCWKRIA